MTEQHSVGIDALRHAIRTQPIESWYLVLASKAMYGTRDYDHVRKQSYGGFNWEWTIKQLDALVIEGWLHRPDGVQYVPTAAARSTWPAERPAA